MIRKRILPDNKHTAEKAERKYIKDNLFFMGDPFSEKRGKIVICFFFI